MAALLREALGDSLRRVRMDQGRTLRQISTDARVSLGYLSEIERGQKEASSELLASICDALHVEIGDVVRDAGTALRRAVAPETRIDPTRIDADTRVVIPAPADAGALTAA
ncbi:helix-turn-helix domain-containing protein [Williamsia deligens]|uniref:Helix-turn-helix domain-containing protein n=1 Tax=Williamsia deligens TaxID=321325 RepID=A0ABW3GCS7_9NOCA|nr:helix-turn-helix transcriptional regulator [Williamsia deligens]MCP2195450.1 Helix-turn-helix domain-containing protein [Williamsia deligens]